MSKAKWMSTVIILVVVGGIGFWYFSSGKITVTLTRAEVQEKINKKLPKEKRKSNLLFTTIGRIESAEVYFVEKSNRIGADVSFMVGIESRLNKGEPKWYKAKVRLHSDLRYEPENYSFYMKQPIVESISAEYLPSSFADKLQKFMNKTVSEHMHHIPVYTIKPKDIKKRLTRALLKNVKVDNQRMILTLTAR